MILKPGARAYLYGRISTDDGRQNLDNQSRVLRQYSNAAKWKVIGTSSDQVSGASKKRPGLDAVLNAAAAHTFDVLLVTELSRLTRGGIAETFAYIKTLRAYGVELICVNEPHFRTDGPTGELFIAFAAWFAAQERETLRRRVRAGMDTARSRGKHVGRPSIVIDVDRIAQMRQEGATIPEIAKRFKTSVTTVIRRMRDANNA